MPSGTSIKTGRRPLLTRDLGRMPLREAWDLQRRLWQRVVDDPAAPEWLLTVQHPPVYTLGVHGHRENLLLRTLPAGVECVRLDRGGDITYHGPGQLVLYAIVDMARHRLGVKPYVDTLEQAVIATLRRWGINGERDAGATGVWLDAGQPGRQRKICAIGVRCSRWVTMHGLALNVDTDLEAFRAINPCGFTDRGVTSMAAELGRQVPVDQVAAALIQELKRLLGSEDSEVSETSDKSEP